MTFKNFTALALEGKLGWRNVSRERDYIGMAGEVAHKLREAKTYQLKSWW